jgi:competence protein ComEC
VGHVVESRIAPVGGPPRGPGASLERLRRRAADGLDPPELPEPSGALLRALITGDRSRLSREIRQPFEQSGTAHLLAVSGLHVGWAFLLGRLAGLAALYPWRSVRVQRARRRWALFSGLALAGSYAALAGLSVPTLRAAAMATAGAAVLLVGRRATAWNTLAGAGLLILALDPSSLFEPAFGLSFLAVAGILLWQPRGHFVGRLVGCTLGASLGTAPLVVYLGLPLPTFAIVANLLLVPWFTAVVVPVGLLAAAIAMFEPSAAAPLSAGARAVAQAGLDAAGLLRSSDLMPFLAMPGWTAAVVLSLFAVRVGLRREHRLAGALCAVALVLALCTWAPTRRGSSRRTAEILFLDVGHGDATLVRSGDATWLIDAGPMLGSLDVGRRTVLPALRAEGVRRLDVLVLTHADRDHIGGAPSVLERVPVGEIWTSLAAAEDPDLARVRLTAARLGVPLRVVAAGSVASLGSWRTRVLWPLPGYRTVDRNAGSLVVRFEGPGGCALLPGDVPAEVERRLLVDLTLCSVLKLGHHGSRSSSGPQWLDVLSPEIAVASASPSRRDRFPGPVLRDRLRARSIALYETSRFGAVRICFADPPFVLPYRVDRDLESRQR